MPSWQLLPIEVRCMVLQRLAAMEEDTTHARAAYATVCEEWRLVFEPLAFGHLALQDNDLDAFADLVYHNRRLLGHVSRLQLRINLGPDDFPEYKLEGNTGVPVYVSSLVCGDPSADSPCRSSNMQTFIDAIGKLLVALAAWQDRLSSGPPRGVRLQLSVSSPSDGQSLLDDDIHCWDGGRLERRHVPFASLCRILCTAPLYFDPAAFAWPARTGGTMPSVPIVRELVVRREFYRLVDPSVWNLLVDRFPGLLSLRLEQWRPVREWQCADFDKTCCTRFAQGLPPPLQHLSLHLDFHNILHRDYGALLDRQPAPAVGRSLARASHLLTTLSASFLVDAADFFADASTAGPGWPRLTSLTLTSRLLQPSVEPAAAEAMLLAAAQAVQQMPRLARLELWYGGHGHACIFRFERSPPVLTLEASWDTSAVLTARLVAQWQHVAAWQTLAVQTTMLNPVARSWTYFGALERLKSQRLVLDMHGDRTQQEEKCDMD